VRSENDHDPGTQQITPAGRDCLGKAQSQFFAREPAVEERDSIVLAREEKTLRLREARLAREVAATAPLFPRRAKKVSPFG